MEKLIPLPLTFKKGGYLYKQLYRKTKAAIYVGIDCKTGNIEKYVVFKVYIIKSKDNLLSAIAFFRHERIYEKYPSGEDFGKFAKCYNQNQFSHALEYYEKLVLYFNN